MTRPPVGPGEAINEGEPSEPRPAASVILIRRGGKHSERALEVLMGQRSASASFMPSVWVFPGGAVDPGDGEGEDAHRRCAARELSEETGIVLPEGEEMILFSRWVTPEPVSTRFDAHFFLALAPAHAPPKADGTEIVDARWIEPRNALDAHADGDFPLVFPTVRQLHQLREFTTADQALEAARSREVPVILPRVIETEMGPRIVLPGDPGYPA